MASSSTDRCITHGSNARPTTISIPTICSNHVDGGLTAPGSGCTATSRSVPHSASSTGRLNEHLTDAWRNCRTLRRPGMSTRGEPDSWLRKRPSEKEAPPILRDLLTRNDGAEFATRAKVLLSALDRFGRDAARAATPGPDGFDGTHLARSSSESLRHLSPVWAESRMLRPRSFVALATWHSGPLPRERRARGPAMQIAIFPRYRLWRHRAERGRSGSRCASCVHAPVDVVAVIGAREAARIGRPVRVPAVDELCRAQRPIHGGELAHEVGAAARTGAAARLAVDGADVDRAAVAVVGTVAVDGVDGVVGAQRGDDDRVLRERSRRGSRRPAGRSAGRAGRRVGSG